MGVFEKVFGTHSERELKRINKIVDKNSKIAKSNIKTEDILIISDDLDMSFGRIRLKMSGSCGGHNGLRNIEKLIGTSVYKRLKFGIENNKINVLEYFMKKYIFDRNEFNWSEEFYKLMDFFRNIR